MQTDRRKFLATSTALLSAVSLTEASKAQTAKKYRLIATEEACAFPDQFEAYHKLVAQPSNDDDVLMWKGFFNNKVLIRRLLDMGDERLGIMDKAGVDVHVLSMTAPGVQFFDADTATGLATSANDQMAEIIQKHPDRYAGLASFAPQDPKRAAKEIDRAMNKLKYNGLIVNSHTNGEYLDDPKYWPIFEAAVANKAAIYIHPRNLPPSAQSLTRAKVNLWGPSWAFHTETGTHAMHLIVSGVFDQFPDLKIVLGHMGESLPFWVYRIDHYLARSLKRKPSEYIKDNFLITTSGVNFHPTLKYCHEVLGPENIMFAIDYPYMESEESARFMQTAPLPPEDMEKMTHGNAERIFHIASA